MWYDSLAILLNEQKEACQLSQVTFCCPCERHAQLMEWWP